MRSRLLATLLLVVMLNSCGKKDWFCSCEYTEGFGFFVFENVQGDYYRSVREKEAEENCDDFSADIKEDFPDAQCMLEEL